MATEGPQLNDGAQTTAAVDLSGATTSYSGPNSSAQFLAVKITASRAVNIDSTGATVCYGILQNTPASGQVADVCVAGISKAVAGAAFSAGALLMTDSSSRMITRTSTNPVVAMAIEAATAANQIVTVKVMPTAD